MNARSIAAIVLSLSVLAFTTRTVTAADGPLTFEPYDFAPAHGTPAGGPADLGDVHSRAPNLSIRPAPAS